MEPASPLALFTRYRMVGLIVLGTLALISASVAVVAAATTQPPKQTVTRDTGNVLPGPSATGSPSPTPTVSAATSNPNETGYGGDQQQGGPRIDYFRVYSQPQCLAEGRSTVAGFEWWVSGGATGATISIDNSEIWRSYSAGDRGDNLPFPCEHAKPGATVKHTYTLRTTGGGPQKSMSVTLTGKAYGATPTPTPHKTNPQATPSAPTKY
jgi:hypothetical protein